MYFLASALVAILYFSMTNIGIIVFSLIGLFRIRRGILSWTPYKVGVGVQLFSSVGVIIQISEGEEPLSLNPVLQLLSTAVLIAVFYYLTKRAMEDGHEL